MADVVTVTGQAVWRSQVRTLATPPLMRTATLNVRAGGLLIEGTTPGSGTPNIWLERSWSDVQAILLLTTGRRTEIRVAAEDTREGLVNVVFRASTKRLVPATRALLDRAPRDLFVIR